MRSLFILLISMMFVAGHGISGWAQPLHGKNVQTEIVSVSAFSAAIQNASLTSKIQYPDEQTQGSPNQSIHCIADCGVAMPALISNRSPVGSFKLNGRQLSNLLKSTRDHFRPPIS